MPGEHDRYHDCCRIESMHALAAAAQARRAPLHLVTYPEAEHGFNLPGPSFRAEDADNAWLRTMEALARLHPVARDDPKRE